MQNIVLRIQPSRYADLFADEPLGIPSVYELIGQSAVSFLEVELSILLGNRPGK
jgi:hypothetical protein